METHRRAIIAAASAARSRLSVRLSSELRAPTSAISAVGAKWVLSSPNARRVDLLQKAPLAWVCWLSRAPPPDLLRAARSFYGQPGDRRHGRLARHGGRGAPSPVPVGPPTLPEADRRCVHRARGAATPDEICDRLSWLCLRRGGRVGEADVDDGLQERIGGAAARAAAAAAVAPTADSRAPPPSSGGLHGGGRRRRRRRRRRAAVAAAEAVAAVDVRRRLRRRRHCCCRPPARPPPPPPRTSTARRADAPPPTHRRRRIAAAGPPPPPPRPPPT